MAAKKTGRLSRADVQKIVDSMSARDMFRATAGTQELTDTERGMQMSERIFDTAAERLGYGTGALDRVGLADGPWLMTTLSESLNVGSPKADSTPESLPSSDTGA